MKSNEAFTSKHLMPNVLDMHFHKVHTNDENVLIQISVCYPLKVIVKGKLAHLQTLLLRQRLLTQQVALVSAMQLEPVSGLAKASIFGLAPRLA
jgi:hypothetical protein